MPGYGFFASSRSFELVSRTLAWSIAVKCKAPHYRLRVRHLPGRCSREATEFRDPEEVLLWVGATPNARSNTFHDDQTLNVEQAAMLLDAEESNRLVRFLHVEDRLSYLAAHAGARLLLGAITGRPVDALQFERSALGKPVLIDAPPGLDFSLSHARGAVAVAAAYMPIGVDIEPLRPIADIDEMSEIALASEERRVLAKTAVALQSHLFLRYWTIKEAVLKAAGVGFTIPPNTLIVDAGPSAAVLSVPAALGSAAQWHVIASAN
ncbi:4'-phosphopantetheinyl transferase family protein [Bradyrhizobium japonicum]|uniref:4'-phosphopantetheinyl transferase family protein n=1 Tax=Bradyrhizobium japonicum TaxID=375 RepID=UPI002011BEF9|nr:4'-phosphopantetheinyl transferase superfamily protein [Bradyrhizobium japonicum]